MTSLQQFVSRDGNPTVSLKAFPCKDQTGQFLQQLSVQPMQSHNHLAGIAGLVSCQHLAQGSLRLGAGLGANQGLFCLLWKVFLVS